MADITYTGANIVAQTGVEGEVFVFDTNGEGNVIDRFSGDQFPWTPSLAPASDPLLTGLSLDPTTWNPVGTAGANGVMASIIIRGTDTPAGDFLLTDLDDILTTDADDELLAE